MHKFTSLLIACILSNFFTASAQPDFNLESFSSGFSNPLDVQNAGDSRLFIVERNGLIKITDSTGQTLPDAFLNLSGSVSQSGGERGLLGLAFHPRYNENGYFFVNYTRASDGASVISRFSVDPTNPNQADANSEKVLFTVNQPYPNHNGGDIFFGPDSYLYISIGDGGGQGDPGNNAQDAQTKLGKILRIDVDHGDPYAIPKDNPFLDNDNMLDEIWAMGLRNPWRNSFDAFTGDLWIADVGERELEEVNFEPTGTSGGKNYGWRCYEGSEPFNTSGCESADHYDFPVFEYEHYGTGCTGSITGGYVYRGALYNGMFGKYIAADYCHGDFYWVEKSDDGFEFGQPNSFSPFQYSAFGVDRYGELYVTQLGNGTVLKVTETSDCRPVAKIKEAPITGLGDADSATLNAFFHPSLEYQWSKDGIEIDGAVMHTYTAKDTGSYTVKVTNPDNECTNNSEAVEVLNGPVQLDARQTLSTVNIYPNPASDIITVDGIPVNKPSKLTLFTITGRAIWSETSANKSVDIHTSQFPAGLYLLKVNSGADNFTKRILLE